MMPGLLAIFSKAGWMVLVWGVVFVTIGLAIQAIALFKTNGIPRRQSILLLIGILLIGAPDGLEIINLTASILVAIALVSYGIRAIVNREIYEIQTR
jgi:hypothetical protein